MSYKTSARGETIPRRHRAAHSSCTETSRSLCPSQGRTGKVVEQWIFIAVLQQEAREAVETPAVGYPSKVISSKEQSQLSQAYRKQRFTHQNLRHGPRHG